MAYPRRWQCPLSSRHGGPDVPPRPWAPLPIPGYPKTRQSLSNPGVSAPSLPVTPADGLPFPGAGYCVTHDSRKSRLHGDDPAGGTVPRLVEGGNGGSPAGHCRPHQRGPCRLHPGTVTGDQDEPLPPTTPSPTPSQILPLQHPFQMQAPSSPPDPTRQVVTTSERWGVDLWRILQVYNVSTSTQLPEIWNTIALT